MFSGKFSPLSLRPPAVGSQRAANRNRKSEFPFNQTFAPNFHLVREAGKVQLRISLISLAMRSRRNTSSSANNKTQKSLGNCVLRNCEKRRPALLGEAFLLSLLGRCLLVSPLSSPPEKKCEDEVEQEEVEREKRWKRKKSGKRKT